MTTSYDAESPMNNNVRTIVIDPDNSRAAAVAVDAFERFDIRVEAHGRLVGQPDESTPTWIATRLVELTTFGDLSSPRNTRHVSDPLKVESTHGLFLLLHEVNVLVTLTRLVMGDVHYGVCLVSLPYRPVSVPCQYRENLHGCAVVVRFK